MTEVQVENGPSNRLLAEGAGWNLREYCCTSGPGDRTFEECHDAFTVAAVIEGSFNYHGSLGRASLYPGTMLLGNAGSCYSCGHDHTRGDRCLALNVSRDYFAEISASHAATSAFTFATSMLPAKGHVLPLFVWLQVCAPAKDQIALDERVAAGVATLIAATSTVVQRDVHVSPRDQRRIREVVHYITDHADEHIDLEGLAAIAATSRFHLLRIFRKVIGLTPYQFVLHVRLRRAAVRLATTTELVAHVAFDNGFGDLSTFNARFRKAFGANPTAFRRRH